MNNEGVYRWNRLDDRNEYIHIEPSYYSHFCTDADGHYLLGLNVRSAGAKAVESQLQMFAEFEDGWNYGEGVAIDTIAIKRAQEVNDIAGARGIDTDVFPCVDGAVALNLYIKNYCLKFIFEYDQTILCIGEDILSGEELYEEVVQIPDVVCKINEAIERQGDRCSLSGLFTHPSSIPSSEELKVTRLNRGDKAKEGEEYLLCITNALSSTPQFVSTLENTILSVGH